MMLLFLLLWLFSSPMYLTGEEMTKEPVPPYLYKVISTTNWKISQRADAIQLSSEDKPFIHLATEDQLDRIIAKYWAEASEYVILKIDTKKLQGRLVLETNPGGSHKYYHLYEGNIPFDAIVESRTIKRLLSNQITENGLEIVQIGEPVLRKPARPLTKEEILSPKIQQLIQEMQTTMRKAPGVGLAAPQIGMPLQLIVIEDRPEYFSYLTTKQIAERERKPLPFHVIINPTLTFEEQDSTEFFEACLSIPHLLGIVPRARNIIVDCLNEKGEPLTIRATGWYARILQHEIDHINGTLFIDRAIPQTIMNNDSYKKCWQDCSIADIKHGLSLLD